MKLCLLLDRCTHSQDLRLGPVNVDQDPDIQATMKMMMRMRLTVMTLMAIMLMARVIPAQTVVVCIGMLGCKVTCQR